MRYSLMPAARVIAATTLFFCAALLSSCDRSPPEPPPEAAAVVPIDGAAIAGAPIAVALKAGDPSCPLPLRHFAPSLRQLVGSILTPPANLVVVDREGRILWNSKPIDPKLLSEFLATTTTMDPVPYLRVYPDKDAPCATVRETLVTAIRIGRCTAARCAFEWPPGVPPPPPPLTEAQGGS